MNAGDVVQARSSFRRALALNPGLVPALGNLANIEARGSEVKAAVLGYRRALAFLPKLADLHLMLGTALLKAGDGVGGERALAKALDLKPGHPMAHLNLGTYHLQAGRGPEAERHFRLALAAAPMMDAALVGLGRVLTKRPRMREAAAVARRAVALAPSSPDALGILGQAAMAVGHMPAAIHQNRRALAVAGDLFTLKALMLALHYDPDATSAEVFRLHREWGARQPHVEVPVHANAPDPERRLKVGYLSADLHGGHPVARNVVGLIEHHDPVAVETYIYAGDGSPDAVTERIRARASGWRSTTGKSGQALAQQMRDDALDILVILAGHTPQNRIGMATLKPAPVQLGMYDYTTSGLSQMDGFLGDPVLTPEGGEEGFTETVYRLPCLYLHMPIEEAPLKAVGAPSGSGGPLTLGSCSNPVKLNDRVIGLWARTLAAVPGARLFLQYQDAFADADLAADIVGRFAAAGIGADRLVLDGQRRDRARHLETVGGFDIALDPFPFNGCTTTFEALWMGVPVVTLTGKRFLGRMSAAMLHQVGLGDLAAPDEAAYVERVAGLAADRGRRAALRTTLRDRLKASALLDAAAHARAVEGVFRQAWRRWCDARR